MTLRSAVRALLVTGLKTIPLSVWTRLRDSGALRRVMSIVRIRPVDRGLETFEIPDEPGVQMVNDGSFISRQVFWLGREGYEGAESAYWEACCRRSDSILELGANIGYFTLHGALAAPDARYVAVEPHPDSARSVARNLELNQVEHVSLLELAVVGKKEVDYVELYLPDMEKGPSPTGAYIAGGESIDRPAGHSVRVGVIEAVELFEDVDLVKLDIEGHEHLVLGAALDLIREQQPALFIEVRRRTPELRTLIHGLAQEGWSVYALGPDRPHHITVDRIASVVLQDSYGTRDVVLLPPTRMDLLDDLLAAVGVEPELAGAAA